MDHVIQQQLFSFSASDVKQVREWEGKLPSLINTVINPSIERYFTEMSSLEEHIIIDKLEIDLGTLNNKSPQQLEEQIRVQLRSQVQRYAGSTASMDSQTRDDLRFGKNTSNDPERAPLSRHKRSMACFVSFLTKGILPWWAEAERVDLAGSWIDNLSRGEVNEVVAILSTHPRALDRLIFQFDEEFIRSLIRHYLPAEVEAAYESWKFISRHYSVKLDNGRLHETYWKVWIARAVGMPADQTVARRAIANWLHSEPELKDIVMHTSSSLQDGLDIERIEFVRKESIPSSFVRTLIQQVCEEDDGLKLWLPSDQREEFKVPGKKSDQVDQEAIDRSESEQLSVENVLEEGAELLNRSEDFHPDHKKDLEPGDELDTEQTALYVSGAGLVLLHPFLAELFKETNLWNGNAWTNDLARHRAVRLLTYLTFGKSDLPEYQVLLPKILCGLTFQEPLDNRGDLPEDIMVKGNELLNAVISHWKAIGNTTIDGLQDGFIRREGKISRKNDDWQLVVERKAQDILLNKLPWGISFIHLPWLGKSNIHVKWMD